MSKLQENRILTEYIQSEISNLKTVFPMLSESDIEKFVLSRVDKYSRDVDVTLHNNYTNTIKETKLSKLINFIDKKKPILVESGVMYKSHNEAKNLNSDLLKYINSRRSEEKNKMFDKIQEANLESDQTKKSQLLIQSEVHDTSQKIYKIVANSLR